MVLDGTAGDWAAAGRATSGSANLLSEKEYTPLMNSNYTATYDLVKGGQVQIIDARTPPNLPREPYPDRSICPLRAFLMI